MSQINVDSIANTNEDGPVYFPYGMRGDASNLIYEPKVLYFDPVPLSTGISTTTNITVTFDQQIQFSGVGTIYIREGSATGTILENFTCGVDPGATIAGETLVINPTSNLGLGTSYYVTLPAAGIANTFGAYYKGTEAYFFQTTNNIFSAEGGDHVFTVSSAPSPTGYHKYHVFTSTGILTTYGPSVNSNDLTALLVAGGGGGSYVTGGGGGGIVKETGQTLTLAGGTYTITIGAGGAGNPPPATSGPGANGGDTTISSSPTITVLRAYGGGGGGFPGIGNTGGSGGGSPTTQTGGLGIPGQGNPGGSGPPPTGFTAGGGGGGAGGSGSNTNAVQPGSPVSRVVFTLGPGGIGAAHTEFASTILSSRAPSIPAPSFTEIGPQGYYAGGGGGGATAPTPSTSQSDTSFGGAGGGGNGAGPISVPAPDFILFQETGFTNTGGGGGAGGQSVPTGTQYGGAAGGSGIFMIRYAVPAP